LLKKIRKEWNRALADRALPEDSERRTMARRSAPWMVLMAAPVEVVKYKI
jgi:hypothetical protein